MNSVPILFSYEDFKDIYPNQQGFLSYVRRNLKSGKIKQIKRGLYALVDPSTGYIYANKFQIASHLFPNSYFSYHDALEYYGLANQSFVSIFTYLSTNRVSDLDFGDVIYQSRKSTCDIEIIDLMKLRDVRVVSLERALVDCIDCFRLAGGLDEVENALEMVRIPDIEKVKELLLYYDKTILYQKVGYLFEKYFGDEIPSDFYDFCLSKMTNKVYYMDRFRNGTKLNSKWKLMIKDSTGGMPSDIY